jgi:SNF2 family DNA or RNA helicase
METSLSYRTVDDELKGLLKDEEVRKEWLFLEAHPDFPGHWQVQGFSQAFVFDMRDVIGSMRIVSPSNLDQFLEVSEALGYRIAFLRDPMEILGPYERLSDPPDVKINSGLEDTINGLLPYQVRGHNWLKERNGVALWSTGTGKTVLAASVIERFFTRHNDGIGVFVAKAHNKTNVARAIRNLLDRDSIVIDGDKKHRRKGYEQVKFKRGHVLVLNYEKFRTDTDELRELLEDENVLIIWDEMPSRLKTRTTQLYKGVVACLYNTTPPAVSYEKQRPKSLQQIMLSGTPIENDPEDFFNCVRILDPRVFGTVAKFRDEYVATYQYFDSHKPSRWHNLEKMSLVASSITHLVDKDDPEIAAQFPDVIEESHFIDWDAQDRKVYDLLMKYSDKLLEEDEDANVLAMISVGQMLCDAPSMVTNSAAIREAYDQAVEVWIESGGKEPKTEGSKLAQRLVEALDTSKLTDQRHTKLDTLRELLCETHPDEKVLIFSAFNEGLLPILEAKLDEWGVTYVRYAGTDKAKQAAQDKFVVDPNVQVFLSSDMGSDSLSLEQASVVIHYDLPWKWSTFIQRQNRVHRIVSDFSKVRYYTLMMADSIEERKLDIIARKKGYHTQIFGGVVAEQAASAKLSREDLLYILRGGDA